MLRFFLRRRARRLDQYWQALSGHDASPPPPPPGLPADLAEQTRWLHSVSQAISPTPTPASAPEQPTADTPPPARPAPATQHAGGASTGSLLLAVVVVCGLIVAATRVTGGSGAQPDALPAVADAENPFLRDSMPPEVRVYIRARMTRVTISETARPVDVAVTADAVWVATVDGATSTLTRVPFDTYTGVEFYAGTPVSTFRPDPPLLIDGEVTRLLSAYDGLWVAVGDADGGRLLRLDPYDGHETHAHVLPGRPGDLLAINKEVWIADQAEARMWQVSRDGETLTEIGTSVQWGDVTGVTSLPEPPGTTDTPHEALLLPDRTSLDAVAWMMAAAPIADASDDACLTADASDAATLTFIACRLWMSDGTDVLTFNASDTRSDARITQPFPGDVQQLLVDHGNVQVLTAHSDTAPTGQDTLVTVAADGKRRVEDLGDLRPVAAAVANHALSDVFNDWIWIAVEGPYGGTELIVRPRADPPSTSPQYVPTATSAPGVASPDGHATPDDAP